MKPTRAHRDLATAALGVAALVALAFGRGDRSAAAPIGNRIPLRIAYFPNVTHAPALVGMARHEFDRDLPGYAIDAKVVNAGPEAMEALLAGELDFAYVGPSPAINTYLKTQGRAVRIVAGACSGGASLVARAGVSIHSVGDLDGKRVAVPQLGGTQDVSCRHFLALNGLAPREQGGTVEIVPIKNPDILALFRQGQLDAAWAPEPWAARLKHDTGATTVVDERDLWPGRRFTTTVLVVRKAFADQHPDAVQEFARANRETIAWIQAHPADAQAAVNGELKRLTGKPLPNDVLQEAWSRVAFTDDPDRSSVVAFAEAAQKAGYLRQSLNGLDNLFAVSDSPPARNAR